MMTKNKILYWPGFLRRQEELVVLRECLSRQVSSLDDMPEKYDYQNFYPQAWNVLKSCRYNWWIGTSLGASVMIYALQFIDPNCYPFRITAINPFYSRRELAEENGFDMADQMDFCLDKQVRIKQFELVVCVNDEKIKMNHGIRVLNNIEALKKRIIVVFADHAFNNKETQAELADILIKETDTYETEYNYCHIYKPR